MKFYLDMNKLIVENNLKEESSEFTNKMVKVIAEEIKKLLSDCRFDRCEEIVYIFTWTKCKLKKFFELTKEILSQELLKFYNHDAQIDLASSCEELVIKLK